MTPEQRTAKRARGVIYGVIRDAPYTDKAAIVSGARKVCAERGYDMPGGALPIALAQLLRCGDIIKHPSDRLHGRTLYTVSESSELAHLDRIASAGES